MKDTSRPRPAPSHSAPYRKRKQATAVSPARGTRRQYGASTHGDIHEIVPPQQRPNSSRAIPPSDEHRSLPQLGRNRAVSQISGHASTGTDGSTHERPPHTSTQVGVPTLPAATTSIVTGQKEAESPLPGSVTAFLRSIELPDKPSSSTPPRQTHLCVTSPTTQLPSLSADNASKGACTNENGYQVNLTYKGYPFAYDLAGLPDDPKGTIALLSITRSDPGAYILVGAHYRRTGRSQAACAVIRSLLDTLDTLSGVENTKGDEGSMATSGSSMATLVSPDTPCKPVDLSMSLHKRTAMRPAMLLLAACELDISRERPDDPESASHASAAHDLFRTVYGTVNGAIIAGAVRPQPQNALGLEFPGTKDDPPCSLSDANANDPSPRHVCPPDTKSLARIKGLEKELRASRASQKRLQEKAAVSHDRSRCLEDKVYALESHSREMRMQLDASQDENWELRQRLVDSEQRVRELAQCPPNGESRVWKGLKDLFDNLGGGVRGE